MLRRHVFAGALLLGSMGFGLYACTSPGTRERAEQVTAGVPQEKPMPPSSPAIADESKAFEETRLALSTRELARRDAEKDMGPGAGEGILRACASPSKAKKAGEPDDQPAAIDQAHKLATTTELRSRAPALLARLNGRTEEELPLEALRVSTVLMGTRARTLVDCTFANPTSRQLEGTFHVRLPEGASPCYLGMFQGSPVQRDLASLMPPVLEDPSLLLNREIALASHWSTKDAQVEWGTLRPAHVVAQEKAAQVYEQVTRRRVDPAVMEWAGGNQFTTRIFPITPNGLKRVFFVYDQPPIELAGQPSVTLAVPEKLPKAFRLEVAASTRAYAGATLVAGKQETPLLDNGGAGAAEPQATAPHAAYGFFTALIAPKGDEGSFVLTAMPRTKTIRAGYATSEGIPGALVHARIFPKVEPGAARATGDAIFLLDTSLSQRTKLAQSCGKLLRAILENDPSIERFQVIGFDVAARPVVPGWRKNTSESREEAFKAVEQVWLEGATSIDCALAAAEAAFDPGSHPTFFLLSDAQVTWGIEDARELERAHPRAFAERWIGYQIGEEAVNRPLVQKLTGRGGRIVNVLSSQDLGTAAVAHRTAPRLLEGVRIEGVKARDLVVAGRPTSLFPDQVIEVAFRATDAPANATIVLEAEGGPQRFSIDSAVEKDVIAARAWAETEATALLELNDKDADGVVVGLSQRFAIANRAASFLILETDAEYKAFDLKTEELDLEKLAELARKKTGRRPIGAPEIDSLDDAALTFLDRISAAQLPAWPVRQREMKKGGFGRPEWPEHLDPLAVYREAARRFDAGRSEEAFRVLTSLIEENPREPKALRLAAFTLMGWDRFEDALSLFGRVRIVRPFEPQAYLGEAFALEALGKTADAALRYELVLAGKFDPRYDGYAKQAAKRLYGRMLSKVKGKLETVALERARTLGCPTDMPRYEVHLLWNLDDTDVDLHCMDSSTNEEVFYSHPSSATGGHLHWDNTAGLGPEVYTHASAEPSEIFVNYFGTRAVAGTVPSATLVVYFRGGQPICRSAVLADQKDKVLLYSAAREE